MMMDALPLIVLAVIILVLVWAYYNGTRRSGTSQLPVGFSTENVDWSVIRDVQIQEALARGDKITAIRRFRELTGTGLKEAKDAIEYAQANPERLGKKKAPSPELSDAGIRDLIAEGRLDEAIEVYRKFAGVDEYTARDQVEQLRRNLQE